MSVFKDFPGLENLKKFKDFQGPARALSSRQWKQDALHNTLHPKNRSVSWACHHQCVLYSVYI